MKLSLKLLEEAVEEEKKDDDILKPLIREICQRSIIVENLVKNRSISQDLTTELEGMKTKLSAIERQVDQFPTIEQVIATSLSKITPVLEKLTSEITDAKCSAIQDTTRVNNNCAIILGHITSTSTNMKIVLKKYIDQKFEELVNSIPAAITQGASTISSELFELTIEQKAFMEQLTKLIKNYLPTLLDKAVEDIGSDC